ncbi:MAG: hypothetical protein PF570_06520 [Candidatus Cloacimonetes bacterium]|jgi:hypothetical protein|nr:hypothetical protein [Candidatus Cloacimonadota bacterium]
MIKLIVIFLLIAVFSTLGYFYIMRPVVSEENYITIDTSQNPQQYPLLDQYIFPIKSKGLDIVIKPFAQYKASVVVLSKKRYVTDWTSIISPIDLALGWGDVSKPINFKHIKVRQTMRWYRYKFDNECAITQKYISTHSSNHHIIPANDNIRKAVLFVKKNDIIVLEGFLVNISGKFKDDNVSWRSSQSRTDTGDGSCEIMYVTSVRIDTNVYK